MKPSPKKPQPGSLRWRPLVTLLTYIIATVMLVLGGYRAIRTEQIAGFDKMGEFSIEGGWAIFVGIGMIFTAALIMCAGLWHYAGIVRSKDGHR